MSRHYEFFGKIEDYVAQPDPILVKSEDEAVEDIFSRKLALIKQIKTKVVEAFVLLNEITQDVMWLNNDGIQKYRDEDEWMQVQTAIAELPSDPDELLMANKMWKIEAGVKQYAGDKSAVITNYDTIRALAKQLSAETSDLEKLNTLLDAIIRLPKVHIDVKTTPPPF